MVPVGAYGLSPGSRIGTICLALPKPSSPTSTGRASKTQQRKDEKDVVAPRVSGVLQANVRLMLQSRTIIPSAIGVPCWIVRRRPLACAGSQSLPERPLSSSGPGGGSRLQARLHPAVLFDDSQLDFSISLDAPTPAAWHAFLEQLWPKDRQSIEVLQEWMRYCLTQDTRQQKILMLIALPCSGKGTIAHVLTRLIGQGNVTGPPFSSFKGEFGLQPLLGKTLAIVPDARLRGQSDTVVEWLLSISGEDLITINRKNLAPVSVQLLTPPYAHQQRVAQPEPRQRGARHPNHLPGTDAELPRKGRPGPPR